MSYETQRDSISRVPQDLLVVGVRYCENWYAQTVDQLLQYTQDFGNAIWTKSGGLTVQQPDAIGTAPDGTNTPSRMLFTADNEYVEQVVTGEAAASKTFMASVFVGSREGNGTVRLEVRDSTGSEIGFVEQAVVFQEWGARLYIHKQFSAGATGDVRVRIIQIAGAGNNWLFWGANLTKNPTNDGRALLFPYVMRTNEAVTVNSTRASRCQAADAGDGNRCFYSFTTCQDPGNFNAGNNWKYPSSASMVSAAPFASNGGDPRKGIREFRFCRQDAPLALRGEDVRPLLKNVDHAAQKIDPERSVTSSDRIRFEFYEDNEPGLWDAVKSGEGAKVNTALAQGAFWRRWLAIFKNYSNPDGGATWKVGFVEPGVTEADFQVRGRYLMRNFEMDGRGMATLTCADRLKLLKTKAPAKISDTNRLNGAINNSVTTIGVDDASEFTEPLAIGAGVISGRFIYRNTVQIDNEKMNVLSRDLVANTLAVQRGRWGTSAASHSDNAAITETLEFGREHSTPSNTPLGKNPIDIGVEIARRAGLEPDEIDVDGLHAERDTWMPGGGTDDVDDGTTFRRTVTEQTDYETLLREVREAAMLFMWIGEDQRLTGRLFAPATPSETLVELTDDSHFVQDTIEINDNDESRVSVVQVAYDLAPGESGSKVEDYQKRRVRVDANAVSRAGYGDLRGGRDEERLQVAIKTILSKWIRPGDAVTADRLTSRWLSRYRNGVRILSAALEIKDDAIALGDFVLVTTARLQKPSGAVDAQRQMHITKKKRAGPGRLEVEMIDTGLFRRYMFIAPAGHPDYDAATPAQRRYGFIGSAGVNLVGTMKEDGYYIW